jgi:hypothetical protein
LQEIHYMHHGLIGLSVWSVTTIFQGLLALGRLDSAIGSVRALVDAEARFARAHPNVGYTCSLSELDISGSMAKDSVSELVRSGRRNGYSFEIRGCEIGKGRKTNLTYHIVARPLGGGENVCADQSEILRFYDHGCNQE